MTISSVSKSSLHAFVRKTKGYRKIKYGGACEDAAKLIRLKRGIIAAVADGHGDPACKYAEIGSAIAVDAACRVLREIYEKMPNPSELCEYCSKSRDEIATEIILLWNDLVLQDLLKRPEGEPILPIKEELFAYLQTVFQPIQQELSVEQSRQYHVKRDRLADLRNHAAYLYGTTLKAILETDSFVLCLSIGDGDIVAVEGERVTWLIPKEDQYSTTTDSLCFPPHRALRAFRHVLLRKSGPIRFDPDYILLATDGFRNSFPSDDHFGDYLVALGAEKESSFRRMRRECQPWIEQLTRDSGCGDDITLCIVY